jgi:tryptophanase
MPHRAEPWRVKMVEPIRQTTRPERAQILEEAGFNLFQVKAEDVFVDLLTDSGTGAMSSAQWAAMLLGDESYAGARSFSHLEAAVRQVMGFPHVLPAHQGRGAEHVLMAATVARGQTVASNALFDTTRAHVEHAGGRGVDLLGEKAYDMRSDDPFKGDMDVSALRRLLERDARGNVALIVQTATCNMTGGQPVSMANQESVARLAREFGVPLFVDAARFAENAYLIQQREPRFRHFSVAAIALEFMAHADGCVMSAKKDALVNIGGLLGFRERPLFDRCRPYGILFEGFSTYGGLAGRDLEAMARGLREGVDDEYLAARVRQVQRLGELLERAGVPILRPVGGHAVYVDAARFLPHIPWNEFPGHALACALYLSSGVRGVEVGSLMAGSDPVSGKQRRARLELFRLAVPRRVYTDNHLEYAADAVIELHERRDEVEGMRFEEQAPVLPHFISTFRPVGRNTVVASH